jgi:hypothetical protein
MYTIYHIPGVKIGCTKHVHKRIKEQGYINYEVLEEHIDINIASDREIALQKQYGYPVDPIPYYKTISAPTKQGCIKGGTIAGKKNGPLAFIHGSGFNTTEFRSKGGKIGGTKNAQSGQYAIFTKLGSDKAMTMINTCPHCNVTMNGGNYFRWHGDKCKAKPQ